MQINYFLSSALAVISLQKLQINKNPSLGDDNEQRLRLGTDLNWIQWEGIDEFAMKKFASVQNVFISRPVEIRSADYFFGSLECNSQLGSASVNHRASQRIASFSVLLGRSTIL